MSFGEEIKRERELREISLREISESTKISLRYLEALERNDFESLPGGVFNRGFVRAYSQFIGIDPDKMVDAYMLQEKSQGGDRTGDQQRHTESSTDGRKWIWVAVVAGLLVAGAAAYWGWTYWQTSRATTNPSQSIEKST